MKTVLVIDDDLAFRSLIAFALQEAGWNVLEAGDGDAGLDLALRHRPVAVVCDLLMPRRNGFQFCRAIRNQESQLGRPRILVMTGSRYASDRENAMEAGADDYFVKPFRTTDLLERLAQTVGGESMALSPAPGAASPSRGPARLKFWGVRGSIATPGPGTLHYGGNTSCVEVRTDGEIIVLDAGTGIRHLGLSLMAEFGESPLHLTILISHTHWDHIQGFPFFIPGYSQRNRIRILGYEGARRGLEITLASQMESPYFPISLQQMASHITVQELRDLSFSVGPVPVKAAFLNHPGVCTGYRIFTCGGSISYLPDVEPYARACAGMVANGEAVMPDYARMQEQRLIDFIEGTDVLIVDCQYDAAEYDQHVGWGHSSVDDSVAMAIKAKAKRLFTFHHDPDHSDEKVGQMVERGRRLAAEQGSNLIVDGAREGLEVVLQNVRSAVND